MVSRSSSRGFRARRVASALLVANAVRPVPGYRSGVVAFGVGMLVGELAPQALALTVADTVAHLRRTRPGRPGARRRDTVGLAAAGVGTLGLVHVLRQSSRVRPLAARALDEALPPHALDDVRPVRTPWLDLATPFARRAAERRHGVHVERDVSYAPWGRRGMLDVYTSSVTPPRDAPVLLQVHGGAWSTGHKGNQAVPLMHHMAARGWVCVAVNYRLAPRDHWPAQITDVTTAIAWIRRNIASYGGDPRYLAITGGSAGGHLAALAALTPGDPAFAPPAGSGFEDADTSVQVALPHYGVYDLAGVTGTGPARRMRDRFLPRVLGHPFADDPESYRDASPLLRVGPDAPDFFVVHGSIDTVVGVDQARRFVGRLREVSRREVVYAELPGAQHAFDVLPSLRSAALVEELDRFLTWHHRRWVSEQDATERDRSGRADGGSAP